MVQQRYRMFSSHSVLKLAQPSNFASHVGVAYTIYKERQIMLSLHLVLVTWHGWFTISIEQDNRIGDTRYNILV
jgi:hypothetical protein